MKYTPILILVLLSGGLGIWYLESRTFPIPNGETISLEKEEKVTKEVAEIIESENRSNSKPTIQSERTISITDGVKHTIPLNEILSGGPGKDGIPSIDNPEFIEASEAVFLNDADPGLGLSINGENRFYPYRILVWHEIVNDTVLGQPVLVTYCPLCATGIVFDRRVDGEIEEFGVSGRLWQSNLLMYNRAANEDEESLWSQVLGEAVLGAHTGKRLRIIRSDVVRFGDWREKYPDTKVLSENTGATQDYHRDPYGDYYTSESVSFGASFNDTRLHPKALVHGIEIDGKYKAYHHDAFSGTVTDTFAQKNIVITKTDLGEIMFTANGDVLPSIPGFWFSWLAVHPETELFR